MSVGSPVLEWGSSCFACGEKKEICRAACCSRRLSIIKEELFHLSFDVLLPAFMLPLHLALDTLSPRICKWRIFKASVYRFQRYHSHAVTTNVGAKQPNLHAATEYATDWAFLLRQCVEWKFFCFALHREASDHLRVRAPAICGEAPRFYTTPPLCVCTLSCTVRTERPLHIGFRCSSWRRRALFSMSDSSCAYANNKFQNLLCYFCRFHANDWKFLASLQRVR